MFKGSCCAMAFDMFNAVSGMFKGFQPGAVWVCMLSRRKLLFRITTCTRSLGWCSFSSSYFKLIQNMKLHMVIAHGCCTVFGYRSCYTNEHRQTLAWLRCYWLGWLPCRDLRCKCAPGRGPSWCEPRASSRACPSRSGAPRPSRRGRSGRAAAPGRCKLILQTQGQGATA